MKQPTRLPSGRPGIPGLTRPPLHFWAVGLLSLFWNLWGAYIAVSAQSGSLPNLRSVDAAYFAAQPLWFVIFSDSGLVAGIAGALAMLLQHRVAVWLYVVSLAIITLGNLMDLAAGTSPLLNVSAAWIGTLFLLAVIAAQVVYARAMRRRGVLE
jgi:hypothetical protein